MRGFLESAKSGENLFSDVLRCKVRADQTRSALTVLQRYKFLFNLPHTIEKNISNVSSGTECVFSCVCVGGGGGVGCKELCFKQSIISSPCVSVH